MNLFNESKSRTRIANRKLKNILMRVNSQIEKLFKLMKTDECVVEAPCSKFLKFLQKMF